MPSSLFEGWGKKREEKGKWRGEKKKDFIREN
jgi:hypothetical protein